MLSESPNDHIIQMLNFEIAINGIIMPLMYGSLTDLLKERNWLKELLVALDHLHTKFKVIHANIKPSHCLITLDGSLVLSDFSCMTRIGEEMTSKPEAPYFNVNYSHVKSNVYIDLYAATVLFSEFFTGEFQSMLVAKNGGYTMGASTIIKRILKGTPILPIVIKMSDTNVSTTGRNLLSNECFVGPKSTYLKFQIQRNEQYIHDLMTYTKKDETVLEILAHVVMSNSPHLMGKIKTAIKEVDIPKRDVPFSLLMLDQIPNKYSNISDDIEEICNEDYSEHDDNTILNDIEKMLIEDGCDDLMQIFSDTNENYQIAIDGVTEEVTENIVIQEAACIDSKYCVKNFIH